MPTWDGFLLPVLQVLEDGRTVQARDLQDQIADYVGLTQVKRDEVLQSGQLRFRNRIGWAMSSLARAGAVSRPQTWLLHDHGGQTSAPR
jgi:restriction system protein